jgi:hypothetical protein
MSDETVKQEDQQEEAQAQDGGSASAGTAVGKGLDIGTANLVAALVDESGDVVVRKQRNAFIEVKQDAYTKNMLTRQKVPYVVHGKKMYVLGDAAFELANVLNQNTRRPMADGLISPKEVDALPIMKLIIDSILGKPAVDGEVCYYSVPAEPIDSDLNVTYHKEVFDSVLKNLGYTPRDLIEGHAVVFSELGDEDFTGIGISCGGGMFNVCVAYKAMPALAFSTSRGGDWIDKNAAQALGMKPTHITMVKEKDVDLTAPKNREEEAIVIYYKELIKYTLQNIADRFHTAENMPHFPDPVSIVCGGGTSMVGGFIAIFKEVFEEVDFPIEVKDIRLASDPFHAVAKGGLNAALSEAE